MLPQHTLAVWWSVGDIPICHLVISRPASGLVFASIGRRTYAGESRGSPSPRVAKPSHGGRTLLSVSETLLWGPSPRRRPAGRGTFGWKHSPASGRYFPFMVVPAFWLETQAWSVPPYKLSISVIMEHRLQGLYGTLHPPDDLFSPFFRALLIRALTATRTVPWLRASRDRSRLVVLQVDLEPHALAASVRHTPTVGHPIYYVTRVAPYRH